MKKKKYNYMLRYTVQPGHHVQEHLEQMVTFCKQAKIDDVMFFIGGESLNQGHLTLEETEEWMEVISQGKELLTPIGITTSINPWPTLLHCGKGRTFTNGVTFNWMVDPYGHRSTSVACPACPDWRSYIAEVYSCYAEIKPNVIWVEDDFRHFNHGIDLEWGGCFCDAHMDEFSRRAGKKLSREEFVEGVLKPGVPHPYRKIWLETARDEMIENARVIGDAVHKVSPTTKVGLMSSWPETHCSEGRSWKGVLKGLAGETPMVSRPTLDGYIEKTAQDYLLTFNENSRSTRAMVPLATEIYPELESCAGLRYTKSHKFMNLQLDTSLLLDAKGMTLNIFDMAGNGVILKEGLQEVLADGKDFLERLRGLDLSVDKHKGVIIPVCEEASFNLHTSCGKAMEELYPREYFWTGLLASIGVSTMFSLEKEHKGKVLAISGQYFRNLSKEEIINLFADNFILLEGEAVSTLFDMGLGHLAGIKNVAIHPVRSGYNSYEQVCDGRSYCGLSEARLSSPANYYEIEYFDEASAKTAVKDHYGVTVGAGMIVYSDKVFVLPYSMDDHLFGRWPLDPFREEIIQNVLREITGYETPLYVIDAPFVTPYIYDLNGKMAMLLVNSSNDDIEDGHELRLFAPEWDADIVLEISRKNPDGIKSNFSRDGQCLVYKGGLKSMETKAFIWG